MDNYFWDHLKSANFVSGIEDIIHQRVVHTAENFYNNHDRILDPCYTWGVEDLLLVPNRELLDAPRILYQLVSAFKRAISRIILLHHWCKQPIKSYLSVYSRFRQQLMEIL